MIAASTHWFLPGTRLGPRAWVGLAIGLFGVVTLFWTDVASFGRSGLWAGAVLMISPVVATVSSTVAKRFGGGVRSIELNRNGMLFGALLLGVLALATERDAPVRWTAAAIGSIAYLAVFGTALAFGLYFWLLRHIPAHTLGLISYVTPAIALTLGTLLGKEPFHRTTLLGAVLILSGVLLVAAPTAVRAPRTDSVRAAR